MAMDSPKAKGPWVRWGLDQDWRRVAILIIGSCVLALGLLRWHPLSPPLEVYGARKTGLGDRGFWAAYHYVTARQAQQMLLKPGQVLSPVLLDVRARKDYEKSHAAGAVSCPRSELEAFLKRGMPGGSTPWILYAYDSDSSLALETAYGLYARGEQRCLYVIYGGFEEWREAGLPVEEGGPPLPRAAGESAEREEEHSPGEGKG